MGAFDNVSDTDENAVRYEKSKTYETRPEEDFRIELRRDADKFKGIKSSFWAGKMAPTAKTHNPQPTLSQTSSILVANRQLLTKFCLKHLLGLS